MEKMKKSKLYMLLLIIVGLFTIESCRPVFISSRPDTPPPPWFYPNRVETIRYVYFPDYMIYYDLSLRNYIYLDNGVWITVNVLPIRYNDINLRRSRYIRIRDYYDDNIRSYHRDNRSRYDRNRSTRSRSTTTRNRNTTTSRSSTSRSRSRDTTNIKNL